MSFHVLSAMNICGRHKRSDEDHRPPGETVTTSTSDKEDVAVNDDDPEAGMRVPTEPRAHIRGRGVVNLAVRAENDISYALTRRFGGQAAYCLFQQGIQIAKIWKKIRSGGQDDSRSAQLTQDLQDKLHAYYQFLDLTHKINGLPRPDRKLLEHHLNTAKLELDEDERCFLASVFDEWVPAYPMEPLEQRISLLPHYEFFRRIFPPRSRQTMTDTDIEELEYSSKSLEFATWTVFRLICAALAVVPVTVQALGVASTTGNVVTYIVSVLILIAVVPFFVRNHSAQLFLILAYAAVVGNNVRG
ncbi:hypothetical protein B0T10DRAFT_483522 [Thelonectria olida]|uniref:DUF6594 domain-containing protein n=1 Tax=Thelonectria olida TaxID=1576542 RepID=A0A9P8W8G9_9HYPO|nr:hypothetical protein B0T10DRAFT_483522 [Thelonectria olida]